MLKRAEAVQAGEIEAAVRARRDDGVRRYRLEQSLQCGVHGYG